ncbi:2-amino-4-hydroxy-6- hydroxymethyldihydropteridin e pyrophosphokinase [Bifidobacterium lemurum]|uniref:2-amino-4-hydroxy-6-hydroxymethyldihydropteridine diphosphokinase n=1 Tax=Bifidobacterium lemurum TaxID=1603886 RepID=A0A261FPY9_9BIFI|nr:2-amino-4-hydroxy-6- hydroxymethyldihydropteridin e pyrophosphokinase [Bifidobacterium lemurum]QOL34650.1 2-amino-4-hydroxy-6-hydroxymethyldihydropteridine diphosphokinase [Bifidobacterium lemurum]
MGEKTVTNTEHQELDAEVTLRLTPSQARRLAPGAHVDVIVRDAGGEFVAFAHDVDVRIDGIDGGDIIDGGGSGANRVGFGPDSAAPTTAVETDGDERTDVGAAIASRRAVISLDSVSQRAESIFRAAIVAIDGIPGNQVEGISPLYHVSGVTGPDAMAAVIQITTRMSARELIGVLGAVEASHEGAVDLDLVDMEGVRSDEPDCRVPWPSAREHAGVLAPWLDMDPDAELGGDPVSFLLAMAPDAGFVGMLSDNWILGAQGLID